MVTYLYISFFCSMLSKGISQNPYFSQLDLTHHTTVCNAIWKVGWSSRAFLGGQQDLLQAYGF